MAHLKPEDFPDVVLPLRVKLMLLISLGVFFFGALNLVIVVRFSYVALAHEQEHRLRFVAKLLAERVERPLLQDDRVSLDRLVRQSTATDPNLAYVLVADPTGSIVGRSFTSRIPSWLLAPELRRPLRKHRLVTFRAPDGRTVREVLEPVLHGKLGTVRVGVDEGEIRRPVIGLLSLLAGMVLGFLVIGLVAARAVAKRVTAPLERIVADLKTFELDGPAVRAEINTGDEMQVLAEQVEAVTDRLQRMYRKEMERTSELARVERLVALGTLTAGLGHELNNPLAGIKNAAQRLQSKGDDPERVRRYAALIEDAVRRMQRLLGDMLSLTRGGKIDIREVQVCAAVDSAVSLAAPRLKAAGGRCEVECSPEPPCAAADQDLLVQALLNLLLNAADAVTDREEKTVTVRCRTRGNDVLIEVEDTGPGVPGEIADQVFNPFFTTKDPGAGTGLGLSVAWTTIRDMGGDLVLESPPGGGARFVLLLPRWEAQGASNPVG